MEFSDASTAFLLAATIVLVFGCICFAALAANRHKELVALRASDRNFEDLYNNIGEGVFRSTLDGHMLSANPALVRLNGYTSEEEMLNEVNDIAGEWYVDPNRRAEIHAMLLEKGQIRNAVSEVYRYKTRERIWIEENTRLVRHPVTGLPRYYEGTVREVTDTIRRLQEQERFEKIASLMPGFLYQHRMDPDGKMSVPYASAGFEALTGMTLDEVNAKVGRLTGIVHPDDRNEVLASFKESVATMSLRQSRYRLVMPDGSYKWVFGQSVPHREPDGSILWHGYVSDVTELKKAEQRIHDLAYRDTLTGLPNRTALSERLRAVLDAKETARLWKALLFIDLDQFKVLNDTKGHHFGDRLLSVVADRLRSVTSDGATIARLGGDEFVVLIEDLGHDQLNAEIRARRVAEHIHLSFVEPVLIEGFPFHTTASIGAALFRGQDLSVDELLKRADMAMYEAKAAGRGGVAFFRVEMQDRLEEELALTNELRGALERGEVKLCFQPQVDDAGNCFGVEALLRWDHPTRGSISPSQFVPLGERAGLASQIDAFVVPAACAMLARWRDIPAMRHVRMAVNVSSDPFDGRIVSLVSSSLRATGVDPGMLTIEVTERVMLDGAAEIDRAFAALKDLGVRIALDDFGTGYSSLSHLKRLPIDVLKIDCSFVDDIETDNNDRVIVQTILSIARNLGVSAIAEGVENEMQALLLRRFGCHAFQGFMYGVPMSVEALEQRLLATAEPDDARPERFVI